MPNISVLNKLQHLIRPLFSFMATLEIQAIGQIKFSMLRLVIPSFRWTVVDKVGDLKMLGMSKERHLAGILSVA
ncbi:hypothetical protein D3C73_1387110 [compost metagenome]